MNQKIIDSITPIFREIFDEPTLVLTEELSAKDVKKWDSLNHIILIVELEALTGLSLSADELAELRNVGDFVCLLANKGYNG